MRISATGGFGRIVLAPLLAAFQALHPAVRYELFFTDRRVDLLREGLDVAFRMTSQPPQAWVAQPVLRFAVHAYGLEGLQGIQGSEGRAHSETLPSPADLATRPLLLLGQNEEPFASAWQHDDGRRQDILLQATAWGSDLEGLIALARHGAGIVVAPDFCIEPVPGLAASPSPPRLINILPGWRFLAGIDTVQALTLPVPAGSETARALVRFVRQSLSGERLAP